VKKLSSSSKLFPREERREEKNAKKKLSIEYEKKKL